jgi:hypothetical protein
MGFGPLALAWFEDPACDAECWQYLADMSKEHASCSNASLVALYFGWYLHWNEMLELPEGMRRWAMTTNARWYPNRQDHLPALGGASGEDLVQLILYKLRHRRAIVCVSPT